MGDGQWTIGRREALGLAAGALAFAACGGSGGSDGAGASTSTSAASPAAGGSTTTAAVASAPGHLDGPTVSAADRIPVDRVQSWADRFAKTWKGSWQDDAGSKGTVDGSLTLDPTTFKGKGTLAFGAGFLGAGPAVPDATYDIDLTHFSYTVDTHRLTSPQFGDVEIDVEGFGAVTLTGTNVPGHPDIDSVVVKLQAQDGRPTVSASYTITRGTKVTKGAAAISRAGDRPAAPDPTGQGDLTAFVGGDYAASLVTAQQLTAAMGTPIQAPIANGGKIQFRAGVNVSNALANSGDPNTVVQYGIYRSRDLATAQALYQEYAGDGTPIPGLGDAAANFHGQFVVVLQGLEMAQVNCVAVGKDVIALDTAVARALVGQLGRA